MDELIKDYYEKNCTHAEIQCLLKKNHDISVSVINIKRILKGLNLIRRNIKESQLKDVCTAVIQELESSGYNLGYRALWQKLKKKYGFTVKRDTVYQILRHADPEGIQERYGNKLRRRQYLSPGPNFLWHMDGYDKLKQFGFAIHGCVDGFSRMVLWLEVASTNNDPEVTAFYYLSTLKQLKFMPTILRSDKGSENVLIGSLQVCLRKKHVDKLAGEKSYITGKSVRNQRIESFWGRMRQHSMDFYIQFFKCMQSKNLFDGSRLHILCLQYCFAFLIKQDLKLTKDLWNTHHIRKQNINSQAHGKPFIMYNAPEKFGSRDYQKNCDVFVVDRLIEECTKKPTLVDPDFKELVHLLIPDVICPTTPEEGLQLYKLILERIEENKY